MTTKQEYRAAAAEIEQQDKEACMKEINAVLKKYGYTFDVLFDWQQLAQVLTKIVAASPKTIALKEGGTQIPPKVR